MQPTDFLKRHSLVIGTVLMFVLTWPLYSALGLFVGYGLALASLIMTGLTLGRAGVRALLRRFLIWRVGVQWYLLILFGPAILVLAAIGLDFVGWRNTRFQQGRCPPDLWDIRQSVVLCRPLLLGGRAYEWGRDWLARLCPSQIAGSLQRSRFQPDPGCRVGALASAKVLAGWRYRVLCIGHAAQHRHGCPVYLGLQQHERQPAHRDAVPRRYQHGIRVLTDCALRDWRCHIAYDMHRHRVCGRVRFSSGSWASAAFAPIAGLRLMRKDKRCLVRSMPGLPKGSIRSTSRRPGSSWRSWQSAKSTQLVFLARNVEMVRSIDCYSSITPFRCSSFSRQLNWSAT